MRGEAGGLADAAPGRGGLRRLPAQRANWRGRVRDAEVLVGAPAILPWTKPSAVSTIGPEPLPGAGLGRAVAPPAVAISAAATTGTAAAVRIPLLQPIASCHIGCSLLCRRLPGTAFWLSLSATVSAQAQHRMRTGRRESPQPAGPAGRGAGRRQPASGPTGCGTTRPGRRAGALRAPCPRSRTSGSSGRQAERVRPVAQVTAGQPGGQAAGDRQVERGDLLGHRGERPFQEALSAGMGPSLSPARCAPPCRSPDPKPCQVPQITHYVGPQENCTARMPGMKIGGSARELAPTSAYYGL